MPETDWLQKNDYRAYPLVEGDFSLSATQGGPASGQELPRSGIVDAGFILGVDSAFEIGLDSVYLDSILKTATEIEFRFRAIYSASWRDFLRCYEWVFVFDLTAAFGETQYAEMTHIDTGAEEVHRGTGFLTVGELTDIAALPDGEWFLINVAAVEPAILQSLAGSIVKQFNLANEARPCPPACPCPSSSSSSSSSLSSSSSSSPSAVCEDPEAIDPDPGNDAPEALVEAVGIVGDVKLKQGFNTKITVVEGQNVIEITGSEKAGAGAQCDDLRTNADGSIREDLCLPCAGLIYTLNGVGNDVEHFQLVGGPGVVVTPQPNDHEIVISLDEDGICDLDL
jgi:hypothetical protein